MITQSDIKVNKKIVMTWVDEKSIKAKSDDTFWWHKVMTQNYGLKWWHKVMTQSDETKWIPNLWW